MSVGGGGSKQTSKSTSAQLVDPNMYQAMYGSGAVQPQFNKRGRIKNAGAIAAAGPVKGGLIPDAQSQYSQGPQQYYPNSTYAPFNPLQDTTLGQTVNYLTSPAALQGYDASREVASTFLDQLANNNTTPPPSGLSGTNPIDYNAIRNSYNATAGQQFTPATITPPTVGNAPAAGGTGVQYSGYLNNLIGDDSAINPHVQSLADQAMRLNTQNYMEQVAPQFRSGERQSGMYGNSRAGIVEARGVSDLNRANADAATNLFGSAWENQQGRRLSAAQQAAGLDAQTGIANAQLAAAAQQAAASRDLQSQLANAGMGMDTWKTGLDYDLASKGLGLNAADQAIGYDLGLRGLGAETGRLDLANRELTSRNAITGAGLANQAAEIPLRNLGSMFGVGQQYQGNTQGQIDADYARWMFNQEAPWANIRNLQSVLQPNTQLGQTQRNAASQSGTNWGVDFSLADMINPAGGAVGGGAVGGGSAMGPGYFNPASYSNFMGTNWGAQPVQPAQSIWNRWIP